MMDRVDRLEHLQNGLLSFYWRSKNKTLSTLINIGDFSGSKMKLRTIPYPHSAKWCLVTLTRLKTIGNKLGDEMVWRSIKCGLKDCARNSWESNKHQNHPRTTTNRTEQPIIPDLDSLWQSRCLLIKPHHWHYDTWTEIRVWAAGNWEVLHRSTWIHLCLCVRKTFFAISPEKWGPFPSIHSSIVVWGMFKTFWRIMNGKIWARRCLHTANIAGRGQACSGFTSDFLQDTFLHRHLAMTQNSRLGQAHLKHYSYPVGGLNILQPFSTPADGTLMKKILWKKIPKHYLQNGKIRAKQMLTTC